VFSVSFSKDGTRIASGSEDEKVKVWSVESGECVTTLEGHSGWVYSVSFSPNGTRIASGSKDNTVKVWSVESGKCVFTGSQLDDSWRTVFKDSSMPERFDDTHTIGLSGDADTNPLVYFRNTHAVVREFAVLHFLERRS
jgi:WD40 repeat protein